MYVIVNLSCHPAYGVGVVCDILTDYDTQNVFDTIEEAEEALAEIGSNPIVGYNSTGDPLLRIFKLEEVT